MLLPAVRVRLVEDPVPTQTPVVLSMVMGLSEVPMAPAEVREMVGAVRVPAVVVTEDEFARVNDWRLKA